MDNNQKKSKKTQEREDRKNAQRAEAAAKASKQKLMFVGGIILIVVAFALLLNLVFGGSAAPVNSENATPDPRKGAENATVVLAEYSDFQCPACKQMAPILEQVLADYPDDVALEYNDFPLRSIHPNAMEAAEAGQCANVQDKFWEYHDVLFDEQSNWSQENNPTNTFVELAVNIGVDEDSFKECLTTNAQRDTVREDISEGDSADVTGTPTIFINGERWANTGTYAGLAAAVEEAISSAGNADGEAMEEEVHSDDAMEVDGETMEKEEEATDTEDETATDQ